MEQAAKRRVTLRLSVTDRCSLRCLYCMPEEGVPKLRHQDVLRFEEMVRFVTLLTRNFELRKVRLTGGEPLIRPGISSLIHALSAEGVADLALTTNGQHLESLAGELRAAGLMRLNVSLDTLDPDCYQKLTRGGDVRRVLKGLQAAQALGFAGIKLNSVILRGMNDHEVVTLARFALERGLHLRFLELMPIGCARGLHQRLFVPAAEVRRRLASVFSLTALAGEPGASSRDHEAVSPDGLRGRLGFIESESRPFCQGCDRLRLTSTGRLIACLARGQGPEIRPLLQDSSPAAGEALARLVAELLDGKTRRASFEDAGLMPTVGG